MWKMPTEIGCIGLHADGLIAALATEFATIELPSGKINRVCQPLDQRKDVMFNDGKCDRQGRFWAGTKDVAEHSPLGEFYRLTAEGLCTKMAEGFTVENGPAWSPDNKILYVCDSPARIIYQYDFDLNTGTINNRNIPASEARQLGHGGVSLVSRACGLSHVTITKGLHELDDPPLTAGRVRRVRSPALVALDPDLPTRLESLVEPLTRGDPESPLRWTSKSTRDLGAN